MTRMIDVDVDEKRISINFPYERELVALVRTLPDRWYDNRTRTWFVPLQHLSYVIQRLEGHHFKHSLRLRTLQESNGAAASPPTPLAPPVPEGTYTISQLNQAAQDALRKSFSDTIWVVGELQDFDKNRASNYRTYFFDLVERPFAGATEIARVKAVLFESDREAIEATLKKSDIELRDGVAVRLGGTVDLYPRSGRFQVIVKEVDPAYTAGEIELNRERVFQALKARGLEERNLSRALPICPLRVGLITSYESDAYNDFVHQLKESGLGFRLTVHHASVQGVHTESSVLRALKYFSDRAEEFDVVAIVRGGGSRSDLAYFDTEAIGEAICRFPLKVICGVGHQRDVCLLDLISESTKTPTAAAELLIGQVAQFVGRLEDLQQNIARQSELRIAAANQRLIRNAGRLERAVTRQLSGARRRQAQIEASLGEGARARLARERRVVERKSVRLESCSNRITQARHLEIEQARHALSRRRLGRELQRHRERLEAKVSVLEKAALRDTEKARRDLDRLAEHLELVDPRRILERGFALLVGEQGVLRSTEELAPGQEFRVRLADGSFRARRLENDNEREKK